MCTQSNKGPNQKIKQTGTKPSKKTQEPKETQHKSPQTELNRFN